MQRDWAPVRPAPHRWIRPMDQIQWADWAGTRQPACGVRRVGTTELVYKVQLYPVFCLIQFVYHNCLGMCKQGKLVVFKQKCKWSLMPKSTMWYLLPKMPLSLNTILDQDLWGGWFHWSMNTKLTLVTGFCFRNRKWSFLHAGFCWLLCSKVLTPLSTVCCKVQVFQSI